MLCTLAITAVCSVAGASQAPPEWNPTQAQRNAAYLTLQRCEDWENRNIIESGVKTLVCDYAEQKPGCYKIIPSRNRGYCYLLMRGHVTIGPRKGQTRECTSTEVYYSTKWWYYYQPPKTRTVRTRNPDVASGKLIPWKWECHWGING